MSTLARVVFATLVAATFGAFFVAQRLKNAPTVVQRFHVIPLFSPNSDGRLDRTKFTFLLKEPDVVDVDVLDADGDAVRALARRRRMRAYRAIDLPWDGRDDAGRRLPDGTYRARVVLRRQGRSIFGARSVRLDTPPPKVRVTGIGPETRPTPEFLPERDGRPVSVNFDAPGRHKEVTIWRTDGAAPVAVAGSGRTLGDEATSWRWDGTVAGRRAHAGTYLAVVESRDSAGNIGASVPLRARVPLLQYGRRLPGRGGITVRYLGLQPPSAPVIAGTVTDVLVDARGERWRWSLRRVGSPAVLARTRGAALTGARLPLRVPDRTGTYLLEVRTRTHRAQVPIVVQANVPVGRVLVVLPWMTWQGRNALDDDGDGRANTLEAGVGVRADRILAGDGLPTGFASHEAPVLAFLDRTRRRYDLTTDLALARGQGPALDDFRGVLLPGDTRWLPAALGARLRRFARAGGTVVSLGTDSLRRQVDLQPKRLVRPTTPTRADLFGALLEPLQRGPTSLTVAEDRIDLFAGDEGVLPGVERYEPTGGESGAAVVADAVSDGGRRVVVAARVGRGLVVRTGLPDFAARLRTRAGSAALLNRLWALLARGQGPG